MSHFIPYSFLNWLLCLFIWSCKKVFVSTISFALKYNPVAPSVKISWIALIGFLSKNVSFFIFTFSLSSDDGLLSLGCGNIPIKRFCVCFCWSQEVSGVLHFDLHTLPGVKSPSTLTHSPTGDWTLPKESWFFPTHTLKKSWDVTFWASLVRVFLTSFHWREDGRGKPLEESKLEVLTSCEPGPHLPFPSRRWAHVCVMCVLGHCSRVWLVVTLQTVARQAPLSMGFSRQEYWSGLPCLLQEIFLNQVLNPCLLHLLHCKQTLQLSHWGSPMELISPENKYKCGAHGLPHHFFHTWHILHWTADCS